MKISWIEPQRLAASYIPLGANDIQSLYAQGIRAILSLTEQPLTALREITPDLLTGLDLTYFHVPIPDQHPPTREQAQAEIRAKRKQCLLLSDVQQEFVRSYITSLKS